jgi:L-2-hydroxyglutarate oxidase LhgO
MRSFALTAEEQGAVIAYRSRVTGLHAAPSAYEVEINGGEYRFQTKVLINCAGLYADQIAALAGLDIDKLGYRLKYCKGDYFTISPSPRVRHLVYPVPIKNNEALGIHATIDLNNRVRFGPDSEYVTELSYAIAEEKRSTFYEAIKRYLPRIELSALQPDMSGIRPKLQGPGDPYRDFVIREERDNGCPGLINLIGIESPGMTSCLAIGKHVASLVAQIL